MNYIAIIIALILVAVGARFLTAPKEPRETTTTSSPSAIESMFAPGEDEAAKKIREMREQQKQMLDQQKKMQQDRLNTYGTVEP